MHTVESLIGAVCEDFRRHDLTYGHGTDNPWDEAVALVLGITGLADDQASLSVALEEAQVQACLQASDRRIKERIPLAYVLGRCQFMGYDFEVRPGVVVPRSPIGYLLHEGLAPWMPSNVHSVLDLCTGSGCLGIIAAHLFPHATVTLVEFDPVAFEVAQRNIQAHGLTERVTAQLGDVTQDIQFSEPFDLIISNPPYVDAPDMASLPAEFMAEPSHGLGAGVDGLAVIHGILRQLPSWLSATGLFVGEIGASAAALQRAYPELPFVWPELALGGEGVFALEASALSSHTAAG